MPDENYSTTEGWDSYRKLIIETMKRLDDKLSDIEEEIKTNRDQINSLINKNTDTRFDKVDQLINHDIPDKIQKINDALADIKTSISNDNLRRRIFTIVGSGVWGLIILIVGTYLNVHIGH